MLRLTLLTVALSAASLARPAQACAPVYPDGKYVSIPSEEALIVWDAAAGVEHFIRRANFRSDSEDFGFLVPTPTPPELSEVDDGVFSRLRTYRQPAVEYTHALQPMTCCMAPFMFFLAGAEAPVELAASAGVSAVEVLSETRVAGLDATVVRASDAAALGSWLGERGYDDRPALIAWLAPYVERGFAITAFRFVKASAADETLGSRAVRMTFETDAPFYPYREPADQPEEANRALWVHFVAAERASGRLEGRGEWDAETLFAAPIDDPVALLRDSRSGLAGDLWLTTIIDRASLRLDSDLRFAVASGDVLRPEPIIREGAPTTLWLPIEPVVVLGAGFWWWRRRRARGAA